VIWQEFPPPDELKDGRRFLAAQNGELLVCKYDTSTVPPSLCFRHRRNRVDRKYRYGTVTMDGETFEAQVLPSNESYPETFETIWLTKLRGFDFAPQWWAILDEVPK